VSSRTNPKRGLEMDENAYQAARTQINPAPCVFQKALLARCAACELASTHALAERETVSCSSPPARINCDTLIRLLLERARFALGLSRAPNSPGTGGSGVTVPHAAMMKIQCGGLDGLRAALQEPESDVHRNVLAAQWRWGSLMHLPWPQIVQSVAAWQGRRRGPGNAAP
jgi:hypothetical protein